MIFVDTVMVMVMVGQIFFGSQVAPFYHEFALSPEPTVKVCMADAKLLMDQILAGRISTKWREELVKALPKEKEVRFQGVTGCVEKVVVVG